MPEYAVELTFSGGCVFMIEGPPRQPTAVEVLLVDVPRGGHMARHRPLLTVRANDFRDRQMNTPLLPDPSAFDCLHLDLKGGMNVRVETAPEDVNAQSVFRVSRAKKPHPVRPKQGEEGFLDWIPSTREAGLTSIDRKLAAARIKLPPCDIGARAVIRNKDGTGGRALLWRFDAGQRKFACAEQVVVRIKKLRRSLRIRGVPRVGVDGPMRLDPRPDSMLRLSVTNLPIKVTDSGMQHFMMYRRIGQAPVRFQDIVPAGQGQSPNSLCPPIQDP